jgi:hypothetical protein
MRKLKTLVWKYLGRRGGVSGWVKGVRGGAVATMPSNTATNKTRGEARG